MARGTSIEWARHPVTGKSASLNPIRARNKKTGHIMDGRVGWHCEHNGLGCKHCYSGKANLNGRNLPHGGTGLPFKPGHLQNGDIEIFFDEEILTEPLRWNVPHGIFWCSMTDMYGHWVPDEWLDKIKAVQALTRRHVHFELTKRPERRRDYLLSRSTSATRPWESEKFQGVSITGIRRDRAYFYSSSIVPPWPLPNVWQGSSAATQEEADQIIPIVLETPAALRFMSLEPLLGPIDLTRIVLKRCEAPKPNVSLNALTGWHGGAEDDRTRLDWIIAGGESGKEARPMHPDWPRALRDQCFAAGVPFFFKQWGEWGRAVMRPSETPGRYAIAGSSQGATEFWPQMVTETDRYPRQFALFGGARVLERVGKHAAGRELDGAIHDAMPEIRA